ncbi:hypothetical protein FQN54_007069 [Arachnomyces sp. PD_36]|nr:hypothetical protein FQN54_007069 [Arachnomyces sp. PD_36]
MPAPRSKRAAPDNGKNTNGPSGDRQVQETKTPSSKTIQSACIAASMLIIAAAYSSLSQITLSPVYGAVPSGIFHRRGMMAAALCGWLGKNQLKRLTSGNAVYFLPVFAFYIPTIQYFLFQHSEWLGSPYGPLVTEILTYYPLLALSVHSAATLLEDADFGLGEKFAEHAPFFGSYAIFNAAEKVLSTLIPQHIGTNIFLSSASLQALAAALYTAAFPSKWISLALPSLLFSAMYNVHVPLPGTTAALNSALEPFGYALIDRQDSLTGHISVLDNLKDEFRVMRCDHSLLGGEWLISEKRRQKVKEPIYAIFTMLEAVRLIEGEDKSKTRVDTDSNALVIGLGIGTTPAAFVAHGIDTTIVELDPVVYKFAREYFTLPSNHTSVVEDAVTFVDRTRKGDTRYDYIVHDVFTGGAEPVDLFTFEFLGGLNALLKDDGVIAINYAGDLLTPSAGLIVRTIKSIFPSCRVFREDEPKPDPGERDFTNMVIFCKKAKSPLTFRRPVEADYLQSRARQIFLEPQHEIPPETFALKENEQKILKEGETANLRSWQTQSAIGHWKIMRTVIPPGVWENY